MSNRRYIGSCSTLNTLPKTFQQQCRFSSDPVFLEDTQVMKYKYLREKFKKIQVKPLYRKVKSKNVLVSVHSTYNLDGDGFIVKKKLSDVVNDGINQDREKQDPVLPGACERKYSKSVFNKVYNLRNNGLKRFKMTDSAGKSIYDSNTKEKVDQLVQSDKVALQNSSDIWLRVYPLPQQEYESICSTILRCVACQFGLATMLVLWTLIWVFIINSFEGPYELQVAENFEREQNQLVIDLATELRQITPLSPAWREAIERRIAEERQLTILALGKGAKSHPGQFWDLPGTFLFMIYVMTALGFGAPVPHTVWGRSTALIYAFIAVPAHIYLMVNASTCAVAKLSACRCPLKSKSNMKKKSLMEEGNTLENTKGSPSYSRNSETLKTSKCGICRKKIMRCLSVLSACRCVPAAAILYYACGAVAFGVLRGRTAVETVMFPLEFTTTGGLEHVLGHVRIFYGFYVEVGMTLLSCAIATLRRISNDSVNSVAEKYRLFQERV